MQGPSAIALRQGGQGGALKYKLGVQVVVTIQGSAPSSWMKKTTLQEHFGDFGQILEICTQENGTAIIEYEDEQDALDAARSMDGKKISGSIVNVKIRTDTNIGRGHRGGIDDRVTEMAQKYGLDTTSAARLVSAFRDRIRRGCNLDQDVRELSEHLAASNKPSALVCMKLADLREGKPIGPCKYKNSPGEVIEATTARHRDRATDEERRAHNRSRSRRRSRSGRRGGAERRSSPERRPPRERSRSRRRSAERRPGREHGVSMRR